METQTVIQLVQAVSTMVIAIGGAFAAYYYGYVPRKRKEEINKLKKELLDCYKNIESLLVIESDYRVEESIGKQTTRKGLYTSRIIEPKRVESRIKELTEQTQK